MLEDAHAASVLTVHTVHVTGKPAGCCRGSPTSAASDNCCLG